MYDFHFYKTKPQLTLIFLPCKDVEKLRNFIFLLPKNVYKYYSFYMVLSLIFLLMQSCAVLNILLLRLLGLCDAKNYFCKVCVAVFFVCKKQGLQNTLIALTFYFIKCLCLKLCLQNLKISFLKIF